MSAAQDDKRIMGSSGPGRAAPESGSTVVAATTMVVAQNPAGIAPATEYKDTKSLITGITGVPIDLQIGLRFWGKIEAPFLAYYGQINGVEMASWWANYRERLFARNLRSVLGDTEVNSEIRKTIENDPQNLLPRQ